MQLFFSQLCNVFSKLESISSGNQMRAILSEFLKKVPKEEIEIVSYFTLGQISSKYESINLGMADKMVLKAIAVSSKKKENVVNKIFNSKGDVGLAAEILVGQSKPTLSLKHVFSQLHKIAKISGSKSQEKKISTLSDLLDRSTPEEAKYLSRLVLGTLRLGAGDKTLLDSLAIAFTGSKDAKKKLEHAYNICPDVGIIAKTIASKGVKGIENISVTVGRPIQMMLAQRVTDINTIKDKIQGLVAAEEKYDGERVQAHFKKGKIILFSRRLEDTTSQFPDVAKDLVKQVKAKSFVVEGEIVPVDSRRNLLPFQVLMQRRRKYEIEAYIKKVPVEVRLFDLLELNGKSYLNKSYPERRAALEKIVKQAKITTLAKRKICSDVDCIEDFFQQSLERGCEGIIVKSCEKDSFYQAGTRGWFWIKWKREYSKEIADTFDLVVVGAFQGRGRRGGNYGALLCAAYNDAKDRFETVCKLGSGFKDKDLAELPKKLNKYKLEHKPVRLEINNSLKPDVWFEPKIVVEVLGAEITRSFLHTCAFEKGQGLALRFPRFLRYREDKSAEQATTTKEVSNFVKK